MKDKKFLKYLIFSFSIAWLLQVIASEFYKSGNIAVYQLTLMVSMYAPFAAVLLSGVGLKGLGWKPSLLKGKLRYLFIAWLAPIFLSLLGGALYFVFFPDAFDTSGAYLLSSVGQEGIDQMLASGMSIKMYYIVTTITTFTYAPFLNMLFALGEEVGWRGYMNPRLKEKFGVFKGRIIGGIIWGAWHWPIMILAGYEYGKVYFGAPVLGPIVFCIFTTAVGILLDRLYEKTECIWIPALGHGAINAATLPLLFMNPDYADKMILGPGEMGLISVVPFVIVAAIISSKQKSK